MSEPQAPYIIPVNGDTLSMDIPAALLSRAVRLRLWVDYGPGEAVEMVTWTRGEAGDWQPLVRGAQP